MTKKSDSGQTQKIQTVPMTLRAQSFFRKLKGGFDGLVNAYCSLTKIGAVEAKDLVSKKAATLMSRGQYGKAIDHYNRLIEMGHEEAAVYYNIGICCEREGMDEEAEEAYKKAYEMDKGFTDAVYRLGLLAIKNDNSKAAVKYLGALACKKNVSFDAIYNLGVAHDKLKDYEKAVENFQKAMAIEPNYSKVHKRLGYTYEAMGKREEAMECFKKAMELEEI
jgi:Flp pilus assembly protein TadD